jgi:hypothetical protein
MAERPIVVLRGGPGSFDHSSFKPDFERLSRVAQVVYLAVGRRVRDGSPVIRPAPGTPQAWVRVLRTLAISRSASRLASAWRLS